MVKERSQSYFNASGNPEFIVPNCRMDYTPSLRSKLGSHVKWSNFFGTGQRLHCHTKYREAKVMSAVGGARKNILITSLTLSLRYKSLLDSHPGQTNMISPSEMNRNLLTAKMMNNDMMAWPQMPTPSPNL